MRARLGVTLALVLGGAAVLSATTPAFATRENLTAVALGMSLDAIVAVGMTVLIVSGGFDLSVGAVMGLAGTAAALVATRGGDSGAAALAALAAGLATGAAVGAVNGVVIGTIGVNPLVATLATMSIARGLVLVLTGGYGLSNLPASFDALGQSTVLGQQSPIWAMVVLVPLGDLLLRHSLWLRPNYAVGGNERAARLSGIRVERLKLGNYMLTGTLAGLAGVLLAARLGTASVSAGMNTELRVIAAVVLGGASLSGGEGTVAGAFLGVLLMALIGNALNLFAVSPNWQSLITGGVLLAAVTLDAVARKGRSRLIGRNSGGVRREKYPLEESA
jgi:ribose transport system permease protein